MIVLFIVLSAVLGLVLIGLLVAISVVYKKKNAEHEKRIAEKEEEVKNIKK